MKKLVYILSIAIGLVMTGCAQWEDFDSLAPDTWGATPELTIEIDSNFIDSLGFAVKDELPFTIKTKNATHMGYAFATDPVDVDYTALLAGGYGNYVAEIDSAGSAGWEYSTKIKNVEAGTTYYIYAVAANGAGVQSTLVKVVGAIDVTAPQPLTDPQLTATQKGMRAVIAFSENIVRDETMGAISYSIYDITTSQLYQEGKVADATAAGTNLTVTLPSTVQYAEDGYYIVLLSFEEGAVTDLFGNKMAAIEGVYNVDEQNVENGYWWLVVPASGEDTGEFFTSGDFAFEIVFTEDGKQYGGDVPVEFSLVSESFDLSTIFNGITGTGKQWDIDGLLSGIYGTNGVEDMAFAGISYSYETEGMTVQDITMIDPTTYKTQIGEMDVMGDGTLYPVFIGAYQGNNISLYWDFILLDAEGNPEAPVEDLVGYFAMTDMTPVIAVYGDLEGKGASYYILMEFDDLKLTKGGSVDAASCVKFDKPVKVENAVVKNPVKSFNSIQVR